MMSHWSEVVPIFSKRSLLAFSNLRLLVLFNIIKAKVDLRWGLVVSLEGRLRPHPRLLSQIERRCEFVSIWFVFFEIEGTLIFRFGVASQFIVLHYVFELFLDFVFGRLVVVHHAATIWKLLYHISAPLRISLCQSFRLTLTWWFWSVVRGRWLLCGGVWVKVLAKLNLFSIIICNWLLVEGHVLEEGVVQALLTRKPLPLLKDKHIFHQTYCLRRSALFSQKRLKLAGDALRNWKVFLTCHLVTVGPLRLCWSSKDRYYDWKMFWVRFWGENGSAKVEFGHDTSERKYVNTLVVLGIPDAQLRRPIPPCRNIFCEITLHRSILSSQPKIGKF